MADVTIDGVVEDTEVTGGEKIPVSDGGVPKAVTTDRLKDFVLKRIAALASANKVDTANDGVYLLKGGELKPVSAAVLAAAVMDYAFALAPVETITGNETVSIKDATVKKTLSLDMLKSWLTEGSVTAEDLKLVADSVADKVDKEEGKGLSEKNFSAEDKAKLDGLVSNAQPDWEQTDDTAPDFIKNKPEIPEEIAVDQVLDQNSSNPIANSVVANVVSNLMNGETNQFKTLPNLPEDGNSYGMKQGGIILVVNLSNPTINNKIFILGPSNVWVEIVGITALRMALADYNIEHMAKMFTFSRGELPSDGVAAGIPFAAFVLDNENHDDGSSWHLSINLGDEGNFNPQMITIWD